MFTEILEKSRLAITSELEILKYSIIYSIGWVLFYSLKITQQYFHLKVFFKIIWSLNFLLIQLTSELSKFSWLLVFLNPVNVFFLFFNLYLNIDEIKNCKFLAYHTAMPLVSGA